MYLNVRKERSWGAYKETRDATDRLHTQTICNGSPVPPSLAGLTFLIDICHIYDFMCGLPKTLILLTEIMINGVYAYTFFTLMTGLRAQRKQNKPHFWRTYFTTVELSRNAFYFFRYYKYFYEHKITYSKYQFANTKSERYMKLAPLYIADYDLVIRSMTSNYSASALTTKKTNSNA